ncbi:MAG: redoxin domain-containing protein [Chloroflexi bacterium]|nr:redoxin domain-containing protein [Chloroflexota bacterium]
MLSIGDTASDFTAELDDGTIFRLAGHRGNKHVVIYFYPKDFTRG